jgi:hypothetical protein
MIMNDRLEKSKSEIEGQLQFWPKLSFTVLYMYILGQYIGGVTVWFRWSVILLEWKWNHAEIRFQMTI